MKVKVKRERGSVEGSEIKEDRKGWRKTKKKGKRKEVDNREGRKWKRRKKGQEGVEENR